MRFGFTVVAVAALAGLSAATLDAQPLGNDILITPGTQQSSYPARVACDARGDFVVTWQGFNTGDPSFQVYAQRFDPAGLPLGVYFRVNTYTTGIHDYLDVAMNSSGSFVVVWSNTTAQDGFLGDIFGRLYSPTGAAVGGEFRVSTFTTGVQDHPAVAMDSAGRFVVVWHSPQGGNNVHIVGRRFDAGASALTDEFFVSTSGGSSQGRPGVASDPEGDFVVAWQDDANEDIYAQRFGSTGQKLGGEFRVNTYTTSFEGFPKVAMDASGNFVVAWFNADPVFGIEGVKAQRYSKTGAPLGGEALAILTSDSNGEDVAVDPFGNFVVVGVDMPSADLDIHAERFNGNGVPIAGFRVNSYTTAHQVGPAVAVTNDRMIFVWNGFDDGLIRARLFDAGPQGDASGNGTVDVQDVFYLINFLFAGGPPPLGACDVNFDGVVNVQDVFYLINFLFAGGSPPL
jgi:hypothetical protein